MPSIINCNKHSEIEYLFISFKWSNVNIISNMIRSTIFKVKMDL